MSWTYTELNSVALEPMMYLRNWGSFNDCPGMIIAADNQKIGAIYYPSTTSDITHVSMRFNVAGGDPSKINYKIGVFADSGRVPVDGTQLGGYTAEFAGPSVDGWTALHALTTDTGALTINQPVWIVVEWSSDGVGGDSTVDKIQFQGNPYYENRCIMRHHNGTNWTTTTAGAYYAVMVIGHADGTFAGIPMVTHQIHSGLTNIYTSDADPDVPHVQGVKFRCGSQVKVVGVKYQLRMIGTPGDLVWTVYEGDVLKYTNTESQANIVNGVPSICWFSSPVLLAPDTDLFIIASQAGTSASNVYDMHCYTLNATYIEAMAFTNLRMVNGDGSGTTITPSTLTVSTTKIPFCFPIIGDPTVDLDCASGGGAINLDKMGAL